MENGNAEKKNLPKMAVIPCSVTKNGKTYTGMIIGKYVYYKEGSIWWEINMTNKQKVRI